MAYSNQENLTSGIDNNTQDKNSELSKVADANNQASDANSEQNPPQEQIDPLAEEYLDIAVAYLLKTPTFAYDGIMDTITFAGYQKMGDKEMLFKLRYYSKHPGYGNREGAPVPEEKTLHAILIKVVDGNVTFAGTDNKYDEMTKQYMLFNPEIK
ncbi:MAG: hypothetical protein AABW72_04015 [archaeon]